MELKVEFGDDVQTFRPGKIFASILMDFDVSSGVLHNKHDPTQIFDSTKGDMNYFHTKIPAGEYILTNTKGMTLGVLWVKC